MEIKVEDFLISDHFFISFYVDHQAHLVPKERVLSRNLKSIDHEKLHEDLQNIALSLDLHPINITDFNCSLTEEINKLAPLKSKAIRDGQLGWFNENVLRAKRLKRQAERRFSKSHLEIDRQLFITARLHVKEAVQTAKKQYFNQKFLSSTTSKQIFSLTNQILGKNKETKLPNNVSADQIPEAFAQFFSSKIKKIQESFPPNTATVFEPFIGTTKLSHFKPVTPQIVSKIIMESPSKSSSIDPLPTPLLKAHLSALVLPITAIINNSIQSGTVPDDFKNAVVTPLLKKPNLDQNEMKNYRPVSNLPFISKILEKVIFQQLNHHLQSNNLLDSLQSAYRKGHSTETALVKITNDLLLASDRKECSMLTLLDLSAAFDTIEHSILLQRLESTFGITDTALNWLQSYLRGRHQSVRAADKCSLPNLLQFGVPQGSVLGPLLFTMYTQPLSSLVSSEGISHHCYADDTQLYCSAKPDNLDNLIERTQSAVSSIKLWMDNNHLKLNEDKTEVIFLNSAKTSVDLPSSVLIGSDLITPAKSAKNLGVIIDSELSMTQRINNIVRGCYLELRRISKIRPYLTQTAAQKLVVSLVISKLDYCNALLVGLPKDKIKKLQSVQNHAAKVIYQRRRTDSSSPILAALHWLPVEHRINYKIAVLVFQCLHKDAPVYLNHLVDPYKPARSLRSGDDPKILTLCKTYSKSRGDRSFRAAAPRIWNALPREIRDAESLTVFKSKLKTHYFRVAHSID